MKMSRKYLYPLLLIAVTVALYYGEQYVDMEKNVLSDSTLNTGNNASSEFDDSFLPTSTTGAIVEHNYYTLSYSEDHEQAEWVAYALDKNQLSKNEIKRPYFEEDPKVISISADWRNYKNSGYDRGHLCPAADRRFSVSAYNETFLTSNVSPQDREFNAGIWNRLEQKVRRWAKKHDGVYVVTGGVLKNNLKGIGYENVSVPEDFFKIILDTSGGEYKAIAFLIPNRPSSQSYYDFVVSIDEVEAKTGIDFFAKLPDSVESEFESINGIKNWGK